mgnify:FL=1
MNALIKQQINYLKSVRFTKHKSGNYGMYGLNFLGAAPVIQMNGDIWKFLWFVPGKDDATFVNAKGTQITFNPREIYYSDKRNDIMRMEEINDTAEDDVNNIIIDFN